MRNKRFVLFLLIFVLLIAISVVFYSVRKINLHQIQKTNSDREVPAYEQNQALINDFSLAQSPWPVYRHDSQNTGRSPFLGPQRGIIKW